MKYVVIALAGLATGSMVAFGAGCTRESKLNVVMEEGAAAPHANLPPVPTLPPPPFPIEYSPGVFSVFGVRHNLARNLTKQVTVRGYVTRVYTAMMPNTRPPRHCTERDRCEESKPHFFLADRANETDQDNMLLVTGYANFQSEVDHARALARAGHPPMVENTQHPFPADADVGAQLEITGTFTRRSANNGHADSNGLLDYIGERVITPSPDAPPARH